MEHQRGESAFKRKQKRFLATEETILEEQIEKNRLEELQLARADPSTKFVGDMPILTVKIDGSWSKAGFTSNFGFVVVLSARTGKVLDYLFMSKYCNSCNMARAKANEGDVPDPCENCNVSY